MSSRSNSHREPRQPRATPSSSLRANLHRPRPPPFSRSVSDIPSTPAALTTPQHRDRPPNERAPRSAHVLPLPVGASADSLPATRAEVLSATRALDGIARAGAVMTTAAMDEAVSTSGQGSRKSSNQMNRQVERQNMENTVSGLKQCINNLGELSSETTRLLDDTYYAVLEKMGTLQSTILGLKELALQSRQVTETFERDTGEVARDIRLQLGNFGNFAHHEERITSLRGRVDESRDRISALAGRVDAVRDMVEGWERADKEWQERTRRRLKYVWAVTLAVIFVLAMLFLLGQYAGSGMETMGQTSGPGAQAEVVEGGAGEVKAEGSESGATCAPLTMMVPPRLDVEATEAGRERMLNFTGRKSDAGGSTDDRLRMLDEL